MQNRLTIVSKVFSLIFAFVLIVAVLTPITVFAEEVTGEAQAVIDLISKLPLDSKTVTIENKEDIFAAKKAYNELAPEQKMEIPTESLQILNSDYSAVSTFVLADIAKTLKELPEADKIKESQTKDIIAIYEDYRLLDETAQDAISNKHKEKMLSALYRLSPETLSDEDSKAASELSSTAESDGKENVSSAVSIAKIWQISIISIVALIALCALVAIIILLIRIIKLTRYNNAG